MGQRFLGRWVYPEPAEGLTRNDSIKITGTNHKRDTLYWVFPASISQRISFSGPPICPFYLLDFRYL